MEKRETQRLVCCSALVSSKFNEQNFEFLGKLKFKIQLKMIFANTEHKLQAKFAERQHLQKPC